VIIPQHLAARYTHNLAVSNFQSKLMDSQRQTELL